MTNICCLLILMGCSFGGNFNRVKSPPAEIPRGIDLGNSESYKDGILIYKFYSDINLAFLKDFDFSQIKCVKVKAPSIFFDSGNLRIEDKSLSIEANKVFLNSEMSTERLSMKSSLFETGVTSKIFVNNIQLKNMTNDALTVINRGDMVAKKINFKAKRSDGSKKNNFTNHGLMESDKISISCFERIENETAYENKALIKCNDFKVLGCLKLVNGEEASIFADNVDFFIKEIDNQGVFYVRKNGLLYVNSYLNSGETKLLGTGRVTFTSLKCTSGRIDVEKYSVKVLMQSDISGEIEMGCGLIHYGNGLNMDDGTLKVKGDFEANFKRFTGKGNLVVEGSLKFGHGRRKLSDSDFGEIKLKAGVIEIRALQLHLKDLPNFFKYSDVEIDALNIEINGLNVYKYGKYVDKKLSWTFKGFQNKVFNNGIGVGVSGLLTVNKPRNYEEVIIAGNVDTLSGIESSSNITIDESASVYTRGGITSAETITNKSEEVVCEDTKSKQLNNMGRMVMTGSLSGREDSGILNEGYLLVMGDGLLKKCSQIINDGGDIEIIGSFFSTGLLKQINNSRLCVYKSAKVGSKNEKAELTNEGSRIIVGNNFELNGKLYNGPGIESHKDLKIEFQSEGTAFTTGMYGSAITPSYVYPVGEEKRADDTLLVIDDLFKGKISISAPEVLSSFIMGDFKSVKIEEGRVIKEDVNLKEEYSKDDEKYLQLSKEYLNKEGGITDEERGRWYKDWQNKTDIRREREELTQEEEENFIKFMEECEKEKIDNLDLDQKDKKKYLSKVHTSFIKLDCSKFSNIRGQVAGKKLPSPFHIDGIWAYGDMIVNYNEPKGVGEVFVNGRVNLNTSKFENFGVLNSKGNLKMKGLEKSQILNDRYRKVEFKSLDDDLVFGQTKLELENEVLLLLCKSVGVDINMQLPFITKLFLKGLSPVDQMALHLFVPTNYLIIDNKGKIKEDIAFLNDALAEGLMWKNKLRDRKINNVCGANRGEIYDYLELLQWESHLGNIDQAKHLWMEDMEESPVNCSFLMEEFYKKISKCTDGEDINEMISSWYLPILNAHREARGKEGRQKGILITEEESQKLLESLQKPFIAYKKSVIDGCEYLIPIVITKEVKSIENEGEENSKDEQDEEGDEWRYDYRIERGTVGVIKSKEEGVRINSKDGKVINRGEIFGLKGVQVGCDKLIRESTSYYDKKNVKQVLGESIQSFNNVDIKAITEENRGQTLTLSYSGNTTKEIQFLRHIPKREVDYLKTQLFFQNYEGGYMTTSVPALDYRYHSSYKVSRCFVEKIQYGANIALKGKVKIRGNDKESADEVVLNGIIKGKQAIDIKGESIKNKTSQCRSLTYEIEKGVLKNSYNIKEEPCIQLTYLESDDYINLDGSITGDNFIKRAKNIEMGKVDLNPLNVRFRRYGNWAEVDYDTPSLYNRYKEIRDYFTNSSDTAENSDVPAPGSESMTNMVTREAMNALNIAKTIQEVNDKGDISVGLGGGIVRTVNGEQVVELEINGILECETLTLNGEKGNLGSVEIRRGGDSVEDKNLTESDNGGVNVIAKECKLENRAPLRKESGGGTFTTTRLVFTAKGNVKTLAFDGISATIHANFHKMSKEGVAKEVAINIAINSYQSPFPANLQGVDGYMKKGESTNRNRAITRMVWNFNAGAGVFADLRSPLVYSPIINGGFEIGEAISTYEAIKWEGEGEVIKLKEKNGIWGGGITLSADALKESIKELIAGKSFKEAFKYLFTRDTFDFGKSFDILIKSLVLVNVSVKGYGITLDAQALAWAYGEYNRYMMPKIEKKSLADRAYNYMEIKKNKAKEFILSRCGYYPSIIVNGILTFLQHSAYGITYLFDEKIVPYVIRPFVQNVINPILECFFDGVYCIYSNVLNPLFKAVKAGGKLAFYWIKAGGKLAFDLICCNVLNPLFKVIKAWGKVAFDLICCNVLNPLFKKMSCLKAICTDFMDKVGKNVSPLIDSSAILLMYFKYQIVGINGCSILYLLATKYPDFMGMIDRKIKDYLIDPFITSLSALFKEINYLKDKSLDFIDRKIKDYLIDPFITSLSILFNEINYLKDNFPDFIDIIDRNIKDHLIDPFITSLSTFFVCLDNFYDYLGFSQKSRKVVNSLLIIVPTIATIEGVAALAAVSLVVASRASGFTEIVEKGVEGLLVEVGFKRSGHGISKLLIILAELITIKRLESKFVQFGWGRMQIGEAFGIMWSPFGRFFRRLVWPRMVRMEIDLKCFDLLKGEGSIENWELVVKEMRLGRIEITMRELNSTAFQSAPVVRSLNGTIINRITDESYLVKFFEGNNFIGARIFESRSLEMLLESGRLGFNGINQDAAMNLGRGLLELSGNEIVNSAAIEVGSASVLGEYSNLQLLGNNTFTPLASATAGLGGEVSLFANLGGSGVVVETASRLLLINAVGLENNFSRYFRADDNNLISLNTMLQNSGDGGHLGTFNEEEVLNCIIINEIGGAGGGSSSSFNPAAPVVFVMGDNVPNQNNLAEELLHMEAGARNRNLRRRGGVPENSINNASEGGGHLGNTRVNVKLTFLNRDFEAHRLGKNAMKEALEKGANVKSVHPPNAEQVVEKLKNHGLKIDRGVHEDTAEIVRVKVKDLDTNRVEEYDTCRILIEKFNKKENGIWTMVNHRGKRINKLSLVLDDRFRSGAHGGSFWKLLHDDYDDRVSSLGKYGEVLYRKAEGKRRRR